MPHLWAGNQRPRHGADDLYAAHEPEGGRQGDVCHTSTENLDIIPANIDLSAAEVQLVNEVAREQALKRVLRPVLDEYDVILVDCQPRSDC